MTRWRENTGRKLLALLRALAVLVVACAALTACGGGGDAGPTGKPDAVVSHAPDLTMSTGTAHVLGAAPDVTATGRVNFATGADALALRGRKRAHPPFGVTEPAAVIDLLRGVVHVRAYGGAEVQGDGTKRYEVDIDLSKATAATPEARRADLHELDGLLGADRELWADVFVDKAGRIRRVLLPVHTASNRPYGDDQSIPQMVSVDYSDFGSS
ncbi:MAG: hypothetical protein QOG90_1959 [Actinomycetota bacterium]